MLLDIIKYGPIDLSLGPIFGVWEALVVRKPSLCLRSLRITNLCCDLQDSTYPGGYLLVRANTLTSSTNSENTTPIHLLAFLLTFLLTFLPIYLLK